MKLKDLKPSDYHIYVDLDGVLADLMKKMEEVTGYTLTDNNKNDQVAWKKFHRVLGSGERLFASFDLMPGARELWSYIKKYKPNILTAVGKNHSTKVDKQKREWVEKHFSGYNRIYTVIASQQKAKWAWPDAILIDDREKSIEPWRAKGGIGILHTSAENTISELKKLGL